MNETNSPTQVVVVAQDNYVGMLQFARRPLMLDSFAVFCCLHWMLMVVGGKTVGNQPAARRCCVDFCFSFIKPLCCQVMINTNSLLISSTRTSVFYLQASDEFLYILVIPTVF